MSGIRKHPPIYQLPPETADPFLPQPGRESISSTAAALLLTASGLRSVRAQTNSSTWRPGCSGTGFQVVLQVGSMPPPPTGRLCRSRTHGGAPRLVWSTTPVALITGRRWGGRGPAPGPASAQAISLHGRRGPSPRLDAPAQSVQAPTGRRPFRAERGNAAHQTGLRQQYVHFWQMRERFGS